MTSIWPSKDFNIDISKLSKQVDKAIVQPNGEYKVSFKKPYTKIKYEGSWDIAKKKPNGKGRLYSQNTPPIVLHITFNTDGSLDSNTEGILDYDSYTYKGHFNDNDDWGPSNIHIQGEGTLTFKNHSKYYVYKGNFSKNAIQGQGTMTYLNGASNTGTWQNGKLQGQVIFNNPTIELSGMIGTWKDGKPDDGFCYDEIVMEKKGGEKLVNASYTGFWKKGKTFGPGQLIKQNNEKHKTEKYIGLFIDKKLFSPDQMEMPKGQYVKIYENDENFEYYNGEWKDGKKNGIGVQFFGKNDLSIYNGEWIDNKISGDGTSIYNPTRNEDSLYDINSIYPMYIGKWDNNQQNGFGIMLYDKHTKPIIENNKITNIHNLHSKIGKWQNNKMIQGYELNKNPETPEILHGNPLNPISEKDQKLLHAAIQDDIKKSNTKETFINSNLFIAKMNIDNILKEKIHGLTYEQIKQLSIKHYIDNHPQHILENAINTLTMLQENRRGGTKNTKKHYRKNTKKHYRKNTKKHYRKNTKKHYRKFTRKGGKDPILSVNKNPFESNVENIASNYQKHVKLINQQEAREKRKRNEKITQINQYNEIIDEIIQKQSDVTKIINQCIQKESDTCSIPQTFKSIENKISKHSNAKLREKAEYEYKKIIYLNIQYIHSMIKLLQNNKENTPNEKIIKIMNNIISQLKKHPLSTGYEDSKLYNPPTHMPIEIAHSST